MFTKAHWSAGSYTPGLNAWGGAPFKIAGDALPQAYSVVAVRNPPTVETELQEGVGVIKS